MALTFPSSPANGATSGNYTYDSSKGAWRRNAALPVSVTHSDVAPSNPQAGDQWWKSNEGTLFTYYNDGNSSQWVESTNVVANVEPNPIPAGAMMAWASNTIPANWLLCDGSAVSRVTYASLFAAIGTTYGAGDGSTTFNLPNAKGKTIVGRDSADTNFDTLNTPSVYVGAKTHTLTSAQVPSHTHTYSGTSSTAGSHTHGFGANTNGAVVHATGGGGYAVGFTNAGSGEMMFYRFPDYGGDHSHTYSGTTSSAGSDGAHNNLQPYIVLNYIIKFSAGETPGDSQLALRVGAIETTTVRSVALGGTGASTLTSGGYLKGAGTGAITSQTGIPGADITSGTIDSARMPAGSLLQVVTLRYQGRPAWTFTGDSIISYLNIGITPKRANSLLIAKFIISGEMEYNGVFRGYRDGSLITQSGYEGYNTEDGSIYSGIAIVPYDGDLASTPFTQEVTYFVPANSTAATTLQIAVRPSVTSATAAIYLNRTYNSNGSSAYEIGVSYASVWEIAQ